MFNAVFCEKRCPICTRAREGYRVARFIQRIEMAVTLGGCPWGRARQREYGVRPDEPIPSEQARPNGAPARLREYRSSDLEPVNRLIHSTIDACYPLPS